MTSKSPEEIARELVGRNWRLDELENGIAQALKEFYNSALDEAACLVADNNEYYQATGAHEIRELKFTNCKS